MPNGGAEKFKKLRTTVEQIDSPIHKEDLLRAISEQDIGTFHVVHVVIAKTFSFSPQILEALYEANSDGDLAWNLPDFVLQEVCNHLLEGVQATQYTDALKIVYLFTKNEPNSRLKTPEVVELLKVCTMVRAICDQNNAPANISTILEALLDNDDGTIQKYSYHFKNCFLWHIKQVEKNGGDLDDLIITRWEEAKKVLSPDLVSKVESEVFTTPRLLYKIGSLESEVEQLKQEKLELGKQISKLAEVINKLCELLGLSTLSEQDDAAGQVQDIVGNLAHVELDAVERSGATQEPADSTPYC